METFAVIRTGGKQYKVQKGDTLKVEKLDSKEGSSVNFSDVLLYTDGKIVEVGIPIVSGVKVTGKILEHGKGDKVIIYKYKRRKRYAKKKGHRQPHTKVEIIDILEDKTQNEKTKTTTQKAKATKVKKTIATAEKSA